MSFLSALWQIALNFLSKLRSNPTNGPVAPKMPTTAMTPQKQALAKAMPNLVARHWDLPPVAAQTAPATAPVSTLLWDSPQNSRHSVRTLCDNAGLPLVANVNVDGRMYMPKDIICAVIGGESGWQNYLPSGQPVTHKNPTSTDWGICQINDHYHIGAGKDFPSVEYVLANPEKVVSWMIGMYKAGLIKQWDAYLNGSYKQYL